MSCNRTVVFTTSDSAYPASARMAENASSARRVCALDALGHQARRGVDGQLSRYIQCGTRGDRLRIGADGLGGQRRSNDFFCISIRFKITYDEQLPCATRPRPSDRIRRNRNPRGDRFAEGRGFNKAFSASGGCAKRLSAAAGRKRKAPVCKDNRLIAYICRPKTKNSSVVPYANPQPLPSALSAPAAGRSFGLLPPAANTRNSTARRSSVPAGCSSSSTARRSPIPTDASRSASKTPND